MHHQLFVIAEDEESIYWGCPNCRFTVQQFKNGDHPNILVPPVEEAIGHVALNLETERSMENENRHHLRLSEVTWQGTEWRCRECARHIRFTNGKREVLCEGDTSAIHEGTVGNLGVVQTHNGEVERTITREERQRMEDEQWLGPFKGWMKAHGVE